MLAVLLCSVNGGEDNNITKEREPVIIIRGSSCSEKKWNVFNTAIALANKTEEHKLKIEVNGQRHVLPRDHT